MKRYFQRILTCFLILSTLLAQSQQNHFQGGNGNLNSFELIAKIRGELNAEKRRIGRATNSENFLGSNLFDGIRKKTFSAEDISLMTARNQFQMMIPNNMPPTLLTDRQVKWMVHYFCYGHFLIDRMEDNSGSRIIKKAFYDTLGGFLHYYLLPIAKASFYAGRVKVGTVLKVIAHYKKCRILLNTNGNGWREPIADPLQRLQKGSVRPLSSKCDSLELPTEQRSCTQLNLHSAGVGDGEVVDDNIIVALPRIELEDSDGFLGNIYFPYVRKRTFNLRSPKSLNVLVDFFKTVNGCYDEKNLDPIVYNNKLREWIVETIEPHLNDEVFYPGLGKVLNLYETLRRAAELSKAKKEKKNKKVVGDRMKRCREDIEEALLKHRRKSLKFINLESKAKQINLDCEKNWLEDPLVSGGKTASNTPNKLTKWFGLGALFGLKNTLGDKSKERDDRKKIDKDGSKDIDKDYDGNKDKEKDGSSSKRKSKWGLGNWYKKGSWGLIFPKLKGLSIWEKLWEIFKFIFFLILAIFLLWLLFKIAVIVFTLCAGISPCIEIVLNTLYQFGKLFLKVLAALCSCVTAPCFRMRGGESNKTKDEGPDNIKVVITPKDDKRLSKQDRMLQLPDAQNSRKKYKKEKKPSLLPKESTRTSKELEKTMKAEENSKKDKKRNEESAKKSKEKNKSKSDRRSKTEEPQETSEASEPQPKNTVTKSKDKDKSKKEKKLKVKEPTESTEEPKPEPEKNSKEKRNSKIERKSKSEEPGKVDNANKETFDIDKNSKEKEKPSNKPDKAADATPKGGKVKSKNKPMAKENQSDDSQQADAELMSTRRQKGRSKRGKSRGRNRKSSRSDDSSNRLLAGESNPTNRKADGSSEEDCDGKASWKTFYDF